MNNRFRYCFYLFAVCLLGLGCHSSQQPGRHKVYISEQNGKYTFYRNGKPFFVRGGSGYTNLRTLAEIGGNTIRIWDTTNIKQILDSAQFYHLAVVAGLPMPDNHYMDAFYNDDRKVEAHFKKLKATVNRYKNHPALLCWCLGNELPFPYGPSYNRFYQVFNNVIDMIHHDDPDHPVTTTIMTFQKKNVMNIRLRTGIDFISFNIFGSIHTLRQDLKDVQWLWKGPFMITEWGVEGPWTHQQENAWGAYIENTSEKKAEQLIDVYRQYMPVENPRFLGSLIFYWGQKQELTPTWFSVFDQKGNRTEVINALKYLWTGKEIDEHAPKVKYMLVDNKGGMDNLLYAPGQIATAKLLFDNADTTHLSYKWELLPEDWYKKNDIHSRKKPSPVNAILTQHPQASIKFKTPQQEGPYRLFVYVYNAHGYFATANTPLYVLNNP